MANINSLIGNLMMYLEVDIPFSRETISRFLSAMRCIENVDVPNVKIEGDVG